MLLLANLALIAQSEFLTYGNTGPYQTTKNSNVGPGYGYDVYRPGTLSQNGELHPIITWGNGTGATNESYEGLLTHLASYGFVVIASKSTSVGSGSQMIEGISWLLSENQKSSSIYYHKINPDRIGATGHSQGGAGTINTAENDSRVTCIAPLAPATFTYPYYYSTAGIDCPIFIFIGSIDALANPSMVYSRSYLTATSTAFYGALRYKGHFDLTGNTGDFRKYITAWFVANLWNDSAAENLFFSSNSAIHRDYSFSTMESKNLSLYSSLQTDNEEFTKNMESATMSTATDLKETPQEQFVLKNNYPNPFSSKTVIQYSITKSDLVKLDVYNIMGTHVKTLVNTVQAPGKHSIVFEADDLPQGVYLYILNVDANKQIKQMMLLK